MGNKYPVPIGEIIKKGSYVCSSYYEFSRKNVTVQTSFIKILTAECCVIRIVIDIFDIFTVILS